MSVGQNTGSSICRPNSPGLKPGKELQKVSHLCVHVLRNVCRAWAHRDHSKTTAFSSALIGKPNILKNHLNHNGSNSKTGPSVIKSRNPEATEAMKPEWLRQMALKR